MPQQMADHVRPTRTGQNKRGRLFSVFTHAVGRPFYAVLIDAVDGWLLQDTVDHPMTSVDINFNRLLRGIDNAVTRFTEVGEANRLLEATLYPPFIRVRYTRLL